MEDINVIKPEELIGKDEYSNAHDVDIWIEDEVVFKYRNYIIEAHCTEAEEIAVDYTVYDENTLKEIDGGRIDCNEDDNCLTIIDLMQFTGITGLTNQKFDDVNWKNVIFYNPEEFAEVCN